VPVNTSNRTSRVYGGTNDPHSAMLGGHRTLNTVVLGEGVSKYQIPPTLATIADAPRTVQRVASSANFKITFIWVFVLEF
jgi:hypothetical protein